MLNILLSRLQQKHRTMPYPQVDPQPKFPEIEERTLAFWERDGTFRASIEARPAGQDGAIRDEQERLGAHHSGCGHWKPHGSPLSRLGVSGGSWNWNTA